MMKLSVSPKRSEMIPGWIYMIFQLTLLPTLLFAGNAQLPKPFSEAELNLVFFCMNFVSIWIIFRRYLIGSAKIALKAPLRCISTAALGFCAYWFSNMVIGIFITTLYPDFLNLNDQSILEMSRGSFFIMAIGTVLLVPVVEEVLYRGLIFHTLYNRNRITAYAVSSAIFSLIHIAGYITLYSPTALLLSFIQYIPAGLCLGWAYARADSVWAPILIHTLVNLIGILSMR